MLRDTLFVAFTLSCIWLLLKGFTKYQLSISRFLMAVAVWTGVLLILSLSGFLNNFSSFPPRMMLVLVIPLVVLIGFTISGKSNLIIERLPAAWIVKMQGFRVFVELFIWWAYIENALPVQMTFEGRNFDILVGLSAPLMALWGLKTGKEKPVLILIWNIIGLMVLFNIIGIAVLSMPTPMQHFFNEPANTIVARFPWVLLPGILVTLAIGLHLLSIKQMIRMIKS